ERLLQLAHLVVEIGERAVGVEVLEADRRRAPLHLAGVEERGKRLRNVVEDPLAPFVRALDVLPPGLDRTRGVGLRIAEDVGVAADELLVAPTRHLLEAGPAALLEQ